MTIRIMVPRDRELKTTCSIISSPNGHIEIITVEHEGRTYRLGAYPSDDGEIHPIQRDPWIFQMRDIETRELVIVDFSNAL